MRKYCFPALFLLCAGLYSLPARAAYVTGGELLQSCQSDNTERIYACIHYVAGVIDYHVLLQSLGTAPTIDFCLPDDLSLEKAAAVVKVYLEKSPQQAGFIAAPSVVMALHESFPCAPIPVRRKKR